MIIMVLIKAVPDTAAPLTVSTDGKEVVTEGVKFVTNPYDEHALEEAVILKEGGDTEVVAVSFGSESARQVLRNALAVGADKAILVKDPDELSHNHPPAMVAGVLASLIDKISPDLVITGRQAVDTDDAQVPERVAERLGMHHTSNIIQMVKENETVTVWQEAPQGHRVLELPLPALVTVQKGINIPRYPTVPEVMRSRKKPLEEVGLADLELEGEFYTSNAKTAELKVFTQSRARKILPDDIVVQTREVLEVLRSKNLLG